MNEARLRQLVCNGAYQLWTRGLITGDSGVVSVELHRRRFLATPPRVRRPELQPDQVIVVDIGGVNINPGPTLSERAWRPHRAGYKLNLAEPGALVTTGPQKRVIAATALAEPPIVMSMLRLQPETDTLELGDLAVPVRSLEDETGIMSGLRISPGVAIRDVGLLCADIDLAAVLNWIERIDAMARIELAAGSARPVPPLPPPPDEGDDGVINTQLDSPRIPTHDPDAPDTPQGT